MNILNKILQLLFWGVFVFVVALLAFLFSIDVIPDLNRNILQSGIGAFLGAFFAFIFVKIGEWISIKRKGNVNHFNSLIQIERLLNRIFARLEENILTFQKNLGALESMKLLAWSSHEVPFNNKLSDDLKNIDFVNEYFSFSIDMETLNNDFETMKSMYGEIKSLFLDEKISPEAYKDNIVFFIDRIELIVKHMKNFQDKAFQLLTKTRLLQKEKKNWTPLFAAFPKKHYPNNFGKKIEEESKILKKEIEGVREKSEKEKEEVRTGKGSKEQ